MKTTIVVREIDSGMNLGTLLRINLKQNVADKVNSNDINNWNSSNDNWNSRAEMIDNDIIIDTGEVTIREATPINSRKWQRRGDEPTMVGEKSS